MTTILFPKDTVERPRISRAELPRRQTFMLIEGESIPAPHAIGDLMGRIGGYDAWSPVTGGGGGGGVVTHDATLTGDGTPAQPLGVVTATAAQLGAVLVPPRDAAGNGLTLFAGQITAPPASATQLGTVMAPAGRTPTQGLVNIGGSLSVPLATPLLAGSLTDAPADGETYGRLNGAWAAMVGGGALVSDATLTGDGSATSPLGVVAATAAQRGGIVVPARDAALNGLALVGGQLTAPAASDTALGSVMTPLDRSATQGLVNVGGSIAVPLATPFLAGSMVDAPADGFEYTRSNGAWHRAVNATMFTSLSGLNVTGNEQVGDEITVTVPAADMPATSLSWVCQGNGYGTIFFSNSPGGGVPGGNWTIWMNDQGTLIQIGTCQLTAANFPSADSLYRATMASTRMFSYPGVGGVTYLLRCAAVPTGPANLAIGLQGMIISF
jgi:hypothetical protein